MQFRVDNRSISGGSNASRLYSRYTRTRHLITTNCLSTATERRNASDDKAVPMLLSAAQLAVIKLFDCRPLPKEAAWYFGVVEPNRTNSVTPFGSSCGSWVGRNILSGPINAEQLIAFRCKRAHLCGWDKVWEFAECLSALE